jgi:hypothetical protein
MVPSPGEQAEDFFETARMRLSVFREAEVPFTCKNSFILSVSFVQRSFWLDKGKGLPDMIVSYPASCKISGKAATRYTHQ